MSEDKREMQALQDMVFLDYCSSHAQTPRCGFTPGQLARLYRLADPQAYAEEITLYEGMPDQVVDMDSSIVTTLVAEARSK